MRGAQSASAVANESLGIIPAYAGSTPQFSSQCFMNEDHPRVCGEHVDIMLTGQARQGSSPRMRGALAIIFVVIFR